MVSIDEDMTCRREDVGGATLRESLEERRGRRTLRRRPAVSRKHGERG